MKIRKLFIIIFTASLLFSSLPVFSQYYFYYGKNKVLGSKFKWQHVETANFQIYYYTTKKDLVKKIANAAEYSYNRISNYLNIKIKKRIPLIFYSTQIDFQLTNIIGYVPPGALAFAESTTYRVVVQGDSSFDDLSRTIAHELGHIFEYEILGRNVWINPPPLWVTEGFSDFIMDYWNPFSLMTVRDAVLAEQLPQLQKSGDMGIGGGRAPYDFGHLIFDFLDHKYGKRGIKKFLFSLRKGALFRGRRNILSVFDLSPKVFNYEFGKYARERFKKFLYKENPADYSFMIGPDFPFGYSFSHDISPSGEMLAVLTVNWKRYNLQIVLISMKDGKVLKKITPGFTGKYDYINLKFNPTDGNSFAWNKDSNIIAFFARKEWTDYLVLVNILNKKIIKRIKMKDIHQTASPKFHPGKNVLYFTGQEATDSYIYAIDLDTEKVSKLTDGRLFIKAIDIAPNGKKLVYSAKKKDYLKLYLAPIENPSLARQVTDGDYNDITPVFSKDSKRIYYSSDELGAYNINGIDLEAKTLSRYSDVRTGNFFPVDVPEEKNQVVISTYYKNTFSLYKKDVSTPLEKRTIEFEDVDKVLAAAKEEPAKEGVEIIEKGKYKPFKKLFVPSLPPIGVSVGTDGGFFGYSYLNLTDLMGDHTFSFLLYSYYGYRSYQLSYLNRKGRLQFYGRLFTFKDVYYPYYPVSLQYYRTIRSIYGAEVGFHYPFNRSYRLEATTSLLNRQEDYDDIFLGVELPYGQFFDGMASSVRLSLVGETTQFGRTYLGPNRGHTFKVTFEKYFKLGNNFMDAYVVEADFRKYLRLGANTLIALRLSGATSGGKNPLLTWTGGNNTFRAADFRRLVGNHYFLFNAEFRFPLVHAALTPIGIIGPIRGLFFFDAGGIWYQGEKFQFLKDGEFQLDEGLSSYGFGLEFFLFGYPMHIDWIWKTDFKSKKYYGASFWIGFDF